jgi:hypothetical protein
MADFRDEFQKLLENTYIPSVGDRAKLEREFDKFLNTAFQNIPEKLYRYRQCDEKGYALDSFKNGTISVCIANRFSDKYDSRVYIDGDKVINEQIAGYKSAISDLLKGYQTKES